MATSDSEDFESADEWEEGNAIDMKDKVPSTKQLNVKSSEIANESNVSKEMKLSQSSEKVVANPESLVTEIERNTEDLNSNAVSQGKETFTHTDSKNSFSLNNSKDNTNTVHKKDTSDKNIKVVSEVHSKGDNSCDVPLPQEPEEEQVRSGVVETDGWECEDEIDDEFIKDHMEGSCDSLSKKPSEAVKVDEPSEGNSGGWGGWGSWGVTNILSSATESVSTLTNHVSQGLSTVLESSLGVPNPEELVKQEIEEEKKLLTSLEKSGACENIEEDGNTGLFGLGRVISGVTSITKLVETASTKVVSGGLDTLETIGKKTMEVLQEGDPGLRKKRALFSEKVVLSQLLREAKEKAEEEDKVIKSSQEARKVHFETLFDDYHGLVHLEALEMLSKQCNIKLQSLLLNVPSSEISEFQEALAEIKELCQVPEDDEPEGATFEALKVKLADIGKGLGVPVANEKFLRTWDQINDWIQHLTSEKQIEAEEEDGLASEANVWTASPSEIHQKAIDTLARLTAESVEQFHKTAELLLVYDKRKPKDEAKILLDMTSTFSLQVSTAATVFCEHLNSHPESLENPDTINSHITNIFFEAANSSSYIQEAFQLLIPVLQVGINLS